MNTYLLPLDLAVLSSRLSHALGCRVTVADVRGILRGLGLVEGPFGWLTEDVRPLMLACVEHARASV
ncbi:MAG: hypothetical protein PVJ57_09335 [Phycisphaerae bacterium]